MDATDYAALALDGRPPRGVVAGRRIVSAGYPIEEALSMSVVVRYSPANLTAEKYDATNEQIAAAGIEWPPDGLDHHICFGEEGNLRVSEVWDSREQWQAFVDQLMPVLSEAGIEMSGEPEVFEVYSAERR
jgi:hypothetical protein